MSRTDNRRSFLAGAEDWIAYAESDLCAAVAAQKAGEVHPRHACFHAQQCAEKAIKGVLIAKGKPFPFTHDLEALLALCRSQGIQVDPQVENAGSLTPYAAEQRYPGSLLHPLESKETMGAIALARLVLEWAKRSLRAALG
jgi:HEPN domain-containing protein